MFRIEDTVMSVEYKVDKIVERYDVCSIFEEDLKEGYFRSSETILSLFLFYEF